MSAPKADAFLSISADLSFSGHLVNKDQSLHEGRRKGRQRYNLKTESSDGPFSIYALEKPEEETESILVFSRPIPNTHGLFGFTIWSLFFPSYFCPLHTGKGSIFIPRIPSPFFSHRPTSKMASPKEGRMNFVTAFPFFLLFRPLLSHDF